MENSHIWATGWSSVLFYSYLWCSFFLVTSKRLLIIMSHVFFSFFCFVFLSLEYNGGNFIFQCLYVENKNNLVRNSLWYIVALDRKEHCQCWDDNYNLTKIDKSVLHLRIWGVKCMYFWKLLCTDGWNPIECPVAWIWFHYLISSVILDECLILLAPQPIYRKDTDFCPWLNLKNV